MEQKTLDDVALSIRESYNRTLKSSSRLDNQSIIELFKIIIKQEPALMIVRQRLRDLEREKLRNTSPGKISMAKLTTLPHWLRAMKHLKKEPLRTLNACEDIFSECLDHQPGLLLMAQAGEALNARFISIEAARIAWTLHPENQKAALMLANYYLDDKQPQEAVKILQNLSGRFPKNEKYKTLLREASLAVKAAANAEKKIQTRDSEDAILQQLMDGTIHDAEQAQLLIDKFEAELAQKDSVDMRRRLAEAYLVAEDYDAAIINMEQIAQQLGSMDPMLDKNIEKAYVAKYDQLINELGANPEHYENAAEQIAAFRQEKDAYQLEKVRMRSRTYPNDLQLHYDLALAYFERNMMAEALEEFLTARNHPQRKILGTYYAGRCLAALGKDAEALSELQTALKESNRGERHYRDILFHLARLQEKMNAPAEAVANYRQLLGIDPEYPGAAESLKQLESEEKPTDDAAKE